MITSHIVSYYTSACFVVSLSQQHCDNVKSHSQPKPASPPSRLVFTHLSPSSVWEQRVHMSEESWPLAVFVLCDASVSETQRPRVHPSPSRAPPDSSVLRTGISRKGKVCAQSLFYLCSPRLGRRRYTTSCESPNQWMKPGWVHMNIILRGESPCVV